MPVIALIGAGPSLDYCDAEIARLVADGAHFVVSDSMAAAFLARWPGVSAVVFTVEMRRHAYLLRVRQPATVYAYQKAHERNLRLNERSSLRRFRLLGEDGDLPALYSPGTVLGTMLSYAVAALHESGGTIHTFGADFFYLDNQVYARYIEPHVPSMNRLATRENWQYEMALRRSSGIAVKSGFAIRTAFELMQARENMRHFLAQVPQKIQVIEYSPLGFDLPRVEKRVPRGIS